MQTDDLEPLEPLEPELAQAFAALRETTAGEVASLDVSARVQRRIRERPTLLARVRRVAPLAAAATLILFLGAQTLWARSLRIVAPAGALTYRDGAWQPFSGELRRLAPVRVRSEGDDVALHARTWEATIERGGEAEVASGARVVLERGRLRLSSREDVELVVAQHRLRTHGRVRVGSIMEASMKRNRVLGGTAAGVVAVLALYAGKVQIGEGASAKMLEGPRGALLGKSGEARVVPLAEAEAALDAQDGAARGEAIAAAGEGSGLRTGGYWDEAQRTVRFTLAGEVFDAQSGKPIESFEIELSALSVRSFGAARQLHRSFEGKADGRFTLGELGLGEWRMTVRADGYAPSRQRVQLGAVTDDPYLVVPLSQGGRLSGVVTDWRGAPLEGVNVALRECNIARCPATDTDARGAFVLAGVPEEEPFSVFAEHPRYGVATLAGIEVAPGETEHVQVRLSGILKVFGRVTRGEKLEPAPGLTVRAGEATATTAEDGSYSMLVPFTERAEVRVITGAPLPVEMASYPESRSADPIRWVDAESHVAELEKNFALAVEHATLLGQITNADGTPVAGAKLRLSNTMGWGARDHETFPEQTVTDARGAYRIDDIPAQAGYVLRLSQGGRHQTLGVVTIDEPREVRADFVLAHGVIRGRFVEAGSGEPFPLDTDCDRFGARSAESSAIYRASCLDDGGFEITRLPPGTYRLGDVAPKLSKELQIEGRDVEVTGKGAPADVTVQVSGPRYRQWTARVTDEDGKFVPGVMLRYHVGRRSQTSRLRLSDEGTVAFSVPAPQVEIFIDAPGHAPFAVDLTGRDPKQLLEVRLSRHR